MVNYINRQIKTVLIQLLFFKNIIKTIIHYGIVNTNIRFIYFRESSLKKICHINIHKTP